jgi:hypothetical protein
MEEEEEESQYSQTEQHNGIMRFSQMVVEAAAQSIVYSSTELKNLMERFIQQHIKDRTECFDDDNFPCKRHDCDRKHMYVWNWLKLFQLCINMGAAGLC